MLLIVATVVFGCASPPTRSQPVGRQHRAWTDSARLDWDARAPRPLAATIWYPAAAGSEERNWDVGVFHFGQSALDAPFAESPSGEHARRPLIVLSHGTGGSAAQLSWLAEALAQAGFVVASVNHHGNTATESEPAPGGFVLPWERALDLRALLDQLARDPQLGAHVDTTRVGAAGFSLGGYTALALIGARLPPVASWQQRCATDPTRPDCTLPPEAPFTMADVEALMAAASADGTREPSATTTLATTTAATTDTSTALRAAAFRAAAFRAAAFRAAADRHALPTEDRRIRALFLMAPALVPALDRPLVTDVVRPVAAVLGANDAQVPPRETADALRDLVTAAAITTRPGTAHYDFLARCSWRGQLTVRALCAGGGDRRARLHAEVAEQAVQFFTRELALEGRQERQRQTAVSAPTKSSER
jgi:predicted dienelactone hydrolase